MAYYRTCPYCRSSLDPGEICDCREENAEKFRNKKTDPEATNNRIGKVEQASSKLNYSTAIVQERKVACQY